MAVSATGSSALPSDSLLFSLSLAISVTGSSLVFPLSSTLSLSIAVSATGSSVLPSGSLPFSLSSAISATGLSISLSDSSVFSPLPFSTSSQISLFPSEICCLVLTTSVVATAVPAIGSVGGTRRMPANGLDDGVDEDWLRRTFTILLPASTSSLALLKVPVSCSTDSSSSRPGLSLEISLPAALFFEGGREFSASPIVKQSQKP
ncbi:hypothetical protein OIU74_012255 [Salix koriyanagi]|uniref:Uncharacterized protein n=1 Tax=Salix koriyanagi TaxID=2511006 RepID=A0A9Q0Q6Q0_9ROSI|nr:hypothetical protein OIU74_012255 [Salix koriyanagi]